MPLTTQRDLTTGDANIDGLLSGAYWALDTIRYGFATQASDYGPVDAYGGTTYFEQGFAPVSFAMEQAYRSVTTGVVLPGDGPRMTLTPISGFTKLRFEEVSAIDHPLVMIGKTSAFSGGRAFFPSEDPCGGDVWMSSLYASVDLALLGKFYYQNAIHELGHALGLKHGHAAERGVDTVLPADRDSSEFSVMTYRNYVGGPVDQGNLQDPYSFPQTYMMSDIAALQRIYGANFDFRSGSTVYRWSQATGETFVDGVGQGVPGDTKDFARSNKIFLTVWDGGGIDTYDLSNYTTDLHVDLSPGGYSLLDPAQRAQLDYRSTDHMARGNVFNALLYEGDPRSLIENAVGGTGNDEISGNSADNRLTGGGGADTLSGGDGNDTLDGGDGTDRMVGGSGNDAFYIDSAADTVVERPDGGTDTAIVSLDFRIDLLANVEILKLRDGTSATRLTGGDGNDHLIGNAGFNVIDGGSGADTMEGGQGSDVFLVDDPGDVVVERAGGGVDSIQTSVDLVLGEDSEIEYLTAIGSAAISLTGNSISNTLSGNAAANHLLGLDGDDVLFGMNGKDDIWGGLGSDRLVGGAGKDTLHGGAGRDSFVFDVKPRRSAADRIADFKPKDDSIWLDNAVFRKLGKKGSLAHPAQVKTGLFTVGDHASDRDDYLIYDRKTGVLYYDDDGSGGHKAVIIAVLPKHTKLTFHDFYVV